MSDQPSVINTILNYFESTCVTFRFPLTLFNKIDSDIDHTMPYFSLKQTTRTTTPHSIVFHVMHNSFQVSTGELFLTDSMVHFVLYGLHLPDITSTITMVYDDQTQFVTLTNHGWTPKYYLSCVLDYLQDLHKEKIFIVSMQNNKHAQDFPPTVLTFDCLHIFWRIREAGQYRIRITDPSCLRDRAVRWQKMHQMMEFSGTRFCRHFTPVRHNGALEGGYELWHKPLIGSFDKDFSDLFDSTEDTRTDTRGINVFVQRSNIPSWMFMSFVLCLKHSGIEFVYE